MDYNIELNLFDTHVGLETLALIGDKDWIKAQERAWIDNHQQFNLLTSQIIQIPWQLHVSECGITAQRAIVDPSSGVIDNFLLQLTGHGITKLLIELIPYNNKGIAPNDQTIIKIQLKY